MSEELRIIEESLHLFIKLGVRSVNMDDAARELGISKKTLYKHFSNKADLVERAFTHLVNSIHSQLMEVRGVAESPIDELFKMDVMMNEVFKDHHPAMAFQLRKYYPSTWNLVNEMRYNMFLPAIVENIEQGMKLGLYRANIIPELTARLYFKKIDFLVEGTIFGELHIGIPTFTRAVLEYHLRGICTNKGLEIAELKLDKHPL
jgi:AcrR family transcriptional regulator